MRTRKTTSSPISRNSAAFQRTTGVDAIDNYRYLDDKVARFRVAAAGYYRADVGRILTAPLASFFSVFFSRRAGFRQYS